MRGSPITCPNPQAALLTLSCSLMPGLSTGMLKEAAAVSITGGPPRLPTHSGLLSSPSQEAEGPRLTLFSRHGAICLHPWQVHHQEQSKEDRHFQPCLALDTRSGATCSAPWLQD